MLRSFVCTITVVIMSVLLVSSLASANGTRLVLQQNTSITSSNSDSLSESAYTPVNIPLAGERRFNANSFKVSHNAFEKPEEYDEQLDDYNVWGLELDVHWEGDQFEVYHDKVCLGRNMNEHVAVMTQSVTWREKVTVLWLQINDFGICPLPSPDIYEPYIKNVIDENFGWTHVYTPTEFQDVDNGLWPSWQELVRRGKNLIIVTERSSPHPNQRWFFEVIYDRPVAPPIKNDTIWNLNQVFFNSKDIGEFPLSDKQRGAYWASRIYPDRWCLPGGMLNDPNHEAWWEWEDHVLTEATQVATNCLDTDWTNGRTSISRRVHPPQPTFTEPSSIRDREYGTKGFPYAGSGNDSYDGSRGGFQKGLLGAIQRVAFYGWSTEIWIGSGDYDVNANGSGGITISKPMILKKNPESFDGVVVIH